MRYTIKAAESSTKQLLQTVVVVILAKYCSRVWSCLFEIEDAGRLCIVKGLL